jgi:hypothetical protein
VLLGSSLVDWCAWHLSIATTDVLCLPDEILKQVALVLGEKENLGLLDNLTEIGYELLAIFRQLV